MRFAICCLATLIAAETARADWPVPRGPSREPNPYTYAPADAGTTPRSFLDDYPACILYAATTHRIEADGTIETTTHEITRLNGRKGVEQHGEYHAIAYDPAYEALTLHEARVHKPNGRVVPVGPKHLQLRDTGTDFLVYDPTKRLIISFPDLEIGDVLEVKWSTRGKNPECAGEFFTRYPFGDQNAPVARDEFRVLLPAEKPFRHRAVGPGVETLDPEMTETEDGNRLYRWRMTDRPPLPRDEWALPREELQPQVACSTFPDWQAVARWKQQLRADSWTCTTDIRAVVKSVTAGLTTPRDIARALTYWVRRKIRYVSVGVRHDYTPHPPATVLANRFGDCKDSTQLLAVMLREAGITVALATIGARGDGQVLEDVPSPWGTHALLLVTLPSEAEYGGKARLTRHWIDTTVSRAAWDELPTSDRDRLAYVVGDQGLQLLRTPRLVADDSQIEQTTTVSIGPDGSTRSVRRSTYHGLFALDRRDDLAEEPPGERRRLLATELQQANTHARLRAMDVDEQALADADRPVLLTAVFEIADHFTGPEQNREGSLTDPILWDMLLSVTPDFDRTTPLDLGRPFTSSHVYEVALPPGCRWREIPSNRVLRSPWGSFQRLVTTDEDTPGTMRVEFRTRVDQTRVAPEDFPRFRKFQEAVGLAYRVYLSVQSATGATADDVIALEGLLTIMPGDAGAATLLAMLYLDRGESESALRVLERARAYHPDDRRLWELTAEAVDDADRADLYKQMVERFPKDTRYRLEWGRELVAAGNRAEADKAFAESASTGPATVRAEANWQRALLALDADRPSDALNYLGAAEKIDSTLANRAAFHLSRGSAYVGLKRPAEARASFRAALEANPDDPEALEAMVRLLWSEGEGPDARFYLRRLASLAETPEDYARAAEWSYRLARHDEAVDLAESARDEDGSLPPNAARVLGLVALKRGQPAEAVHFFEQANIRTDAEATEALMQALIETGRLTAAQEAWNASPLQAEPKGALQRTAERLRQLVERRPALKEVDAALAAAIDRFLIADEARRQRRSTSEVETILGPIGGGVEFGPAVALRAELALERGRLSTAAAGAERALKLGAAPLPAAELWRAYAVRGRVRLEREQPGALEDLESAARLTKRTNADVLQALAEALVQQGRRGEAIAVQKEIDALSKPMAKSGP